MAYAYPVALVGGFRPSQPGNCYIYQTVIVPAGSPALTFEWMPFNEAGGEYSGQQCLIQDTSGSTLATVFDTSNSPLGTEVWTPVSFDMTPYAGQTVRIYFNANNAGTSSYVYFYLKNVELGSAVTNGDFATGDFAGWTVGSSGATLPQVITVGSAVNLVEVQANGVVEAYLPLEVTLAQPILANDLLVMVSKENGPIVAGPPPPTVSPDLGLDWVLINSGQNYGMWYARARANTAAGTLGIVYGGSPYNRSVIVANYRGMPAFDTGYVVGTAGVEPIDLTINGLTLSMGQSGGVTGNGIMGAVLVPSGGNDLDNTMAIAMVPGYPGDAFSSWQAVQTYFEGLGIFIPINPRTGYPAYFLPANIIVSKVTIPSGAAQEFEFVPSWGAPFTLTDGQSNNSGPLSPGTYSVRESLVPEWTAEPSQDPTAIPLAAGQTVEITFQNTQAAPGAGPIMSVAEFPMAAGKFLTVYLDPQGYTWYDDPENAGSEVLVDGTIAPGSQFKAEVYGEKMWFAYYNPVLSQDFSPSPFVGTDIPRYYDGSEMWRVTSDAPGGGLAFENVTIGTVAITSLVRSGNIVTAEVASIPAGLVPSYWVTLEDTSAQVGSVPTGQDPNTSNELFQAMGGTATFQGDGQGNIVVTTSTDISNLPVGAWFYYWVAPPAQIQLESAVFPDHDHVTFTVGSTSTLQVGEQVQIVGATLADANNSPVFTANPLLTISSLTSTTFTAPLINFGAPIGTLSAGVAIPIGSYGFGYAKVSAVTSASTFQFYIPGNGTKLQLTGLVYDLWGIQPSTAPSAEGIAQSFQILSIDTPANKISWYQAGPDNAYTGSDTIDLIPQTAMPAGRRNAVVMFKSQNGAITGPSVPVTVATNAGSTYLKASSLPVGPYGTVARIVAFTASGGSNYFYLTPAEIPVTGGLPALTTIGTVVNDNTSTSFTFDFTDDALLAGTQIDILGNDLFNQDVLSPCLGVCEYEGRLAWFGEINNIKNFVNMGFDGGATGPLGSYFTFPLGWDASNGDEAGFLAFQSPPYLGFAYQMSTGYNNLIEQSAYQDYYGAPILEPTKKYMARLLAKASSTGLSGNLVVDVHTGPQGSASAGTILASATFPLSAIVTSSTWYVENFNAALPVVIPSDATLRVYLEGTSEGNIVTIDELEIIDASYPVLYDQVILSYYQNPFGYDLLTGILSVDPSEPVTAAFRQRGSLYLIGDRSLFQSQNNGQTEPNGWNCIQYASDCGASGPNAVDAGEELAWWGGRFGGRVFQGNPTTKKITQELSSIWEDINWSYQTFIWVRNDPVDRLLMLGIPVSGAEMPSTILTMSYRLSDDAYNIPDPIHINQYSGKVICTDLGRRWSPWDRTINCAAMCTRLAPSGGMARVIVFGQGTGQIPPPQVGGTLYKLDTENYPPLNPSSASWTAHDDDFGQIPSFYTTYFFFPKDIDQNPLLGLYRKLYHYLSAHLTGVGSIQITPYVDAITKPGPNLRPYTMTLTDTGYDIEWHPNVRAERAAWRFQPLPISPSLDAAMALTHLQVTGRTDKVFPLRGTIFGGGA